MAMKKPTSKKNAFYAQSGGVSAVINASACGVIETAMRQSRHIGKVYAGRDGIVGALTEDLIDVSRESPAVIRGLRHTPAGAFGSARFKLKGLEQNRAEYERLIEVFRAHDIGYFFYNGGNDSMDTALKVSQIGDVAGLSRSPVSGCRRRSTTICRIPTAARDSARWPSTSRCPRARRRSMSRPWRAPRPRCSCSRSWAGTPAGLPRRPDWPAARPARRRTSSCCPRSPSTGSASSSKVKQMRRRSTATVSWWSRRAPRTPDGKFLADAGTRDAFGHTQLGGVAPVVADMIRQAHGYKYHWAVADYLQRSARHIASKVDVEQAYAVGKAAVELAVKGINAVMPTIVRKASRPYKWTIGHVPLAEVANVEKKLPRDYITEDGFGITAACRRYLEPLIAGEAYPPYRDGLPDYVRIKGAPGPQAPARRTSSLSRR